MDSFVLCGGPTASGKSSLGIRIAVDLQSAVLGADAVQVYTEASIGSAKVTKEELEIVPHYGIDLCSPGASFDAAQYLRYARDVIASLHATAKTPVIVGGSTMYIKLLIDGMARLPKADPALRERLEKRSSVSLSRLLKRLDPESYKRLHQNDRLRIVRALEILLLSGKTQGELQEEQAQIESPYKGLFIVLWWKRELLYQRINERSQTMIDAGLLDETRGLIERHGEGCEVLRALGYAQAKAVLDGHESADGLCESISQATRRYAKRQMTFWRNEPGKLGWNVYPEAGKEHAFRGADGGYARSGNPVKGVGVLSVSYPELIELIRARVQEPFSKSEVWHLDAACLMEKQHD